MPNLQVWEEDDVQWEQRVNMGQVSREAVLRTQESLTMKLKQQSAREEGICQVLIFCNRNQIDSCGRKSTKVLNS